LVSWTWLVFALSCVGYTVTYAEANRPEPRLAAASLVLFAGAVTCGIAAARQRR
jgi:hypothetical protein